MEHIAQQMTFAAAKKGGGERRRGVCFSSWERVNLL